MGKVVSLVKKCKICGKPIPFEKLRKNAKYCSLECKRINDRQYQKKYQHDLYVSKKRDITKTCPICGNEFTTTNCQQVYCSTACHYKRMNKRQKELKKMRKSPFYNPSQVYTPADIDDIDWDCEALDAYLRRLKAWEWGLVKDDLKTWITN